MNGEHVTQYLILFFKSFIFFSFTQFGYLISFASTMAE